MVLLWSVPITIVCILVLVNLNEDTSNAEGMAYFGLILGLVITVIIKVIRDWRAADWGILE